MHCNWPETRQTVALRLVPYSIKPTSCNYIAIQPFLRYNFFVFYRHQHHEDHDPCPTGSHAYAGHSGLTSHGWSHKVAMHAFAVSRAGVVAIWRAHLTETKPLNTCQSLSATLIRSILGHAHVDLGLCITSALCLADCFLSPFHSL